MGEEGRPVARRHHTVPRFYLRGFSERERIATVRLPGERRFVQSINDASVAKNFYAVEGHKDGDDAIERTLSEIEGKVSRIFQSIAAGSWPLSADDRMSLSYFIALQATRVPVQRRTMDHMASQMLRLEIGAGGKVGLRRRLEERGEKVTEELVDRLWNEATRKEGPPVKRPGIEFVRQMAELAETVVKYIVGRPWSLVTFDRRSLITSDSPVGLVRDPREESYLGVGFMTAWGITFPLTRKLGLLMSSPAAAIDAGVPVEVVHEGAADMKQAGTTKMEKFFNYHTVVNASEWLFHHPADEALIPNELPEPSPVAIDTSGMDREFDGEPWFSAQRSNKPPPEEGRAAEDGAAERGSEAV